MVTYTLKIIEVKRETADTVTVCFKQPALKKIKYLAGQYLTLIVRINGRRYIRPYSLSSAPNVDQNLEVTVKRVIGGVVSNHINDKIAVGDLIEVMPPMGDFILPDDKNADHVILWGAGSGITPLLSIAKYLLYGNKVSQLTLVYGNRNSENVIFGDTISKLKKEFSNFSTWHFHTRLSISHINENIIEGRINPHKVLQVMKADGNIGAETLHFICGPVGLKQSVKDALAQNNIGHDKIFSEDFEKVIDPKEFENVVSQFVEVQSPTENSKIEVAKGKSILEAGLDADLDLSYSCQTGSCLICKAKVLSGKVKMINNHVVELNDNECLLCCSYPLTDDVKVLTEN